MLALLTFPQHDELLIPIIAWTWGLPGIIPAVMLKVMVEWVVAGLCYNWGLSGGHPTQPLGF